MINVYNQNDYVNVDPKPAIVFEVIDKDGDLMYWCADNAEELLDWWKNEDFDGPSDDDQVVSFTINNVTRNGNDMSFDDIVEAYIEQ